MFKKYFDLDNQIPLFNGGIKENLHQFTSLVSELNYNLKNKKSLLGGIQILKFKKKISYFLMWVSHLKKGFSKSYQSGPLSFEYYMNGEKIITNCGFGCNISNKAELLSRLTSAQSTCV